MAIYFLKLFDDIGRSIGVKNSDTIFLGYAADLVRHSAGNGNNSLLSLKEKRLPPLRQGDSVWRNLDIWGRLLGKVVGWIYAAGRNLPKIPNRNLVNLFVRPTDAVEGIAELVPLLGGFFVLDGFPNGDVRLGAVGGNRTLVRGRRTGAFAKSDIDRAAGDTADDALERATSDDVLERVSREALVLDGDVRGILLLATLQSFERGFASKPLDGTAGHAFAGIRSSLHATEDLVHTG